MSSGVNERSRFLDLAIYIYDVDGNEIAIVDDSQLDECDCCPTKILSVTIPFVCSEDGILTKITD